MREFPLDPLAAAGFMLARCAGKDKYYPMIEVLFAKQNEWAVQQPIPPLTAIAKQAGFTQEKFESCLSDQKILDGIEATRARGSEKLGVNSTPTFFVNGKVHARRGHDRGAGEGNPAAAQELSTAWKRPIHKDLAQGSRQGLGYNAAGGLRRAQGLSILGSNNRFAKPHERLSGCFYGSAPAGPAVTLSKGGVQ